MKAVYQQLNNLKLSGMRDALMQQTDQPNAYVELGFEERLVLLLDNEIMQRDNRKIERLTRQAKFRVSAELSQLDYQSSRQISKAQIRSLAQGEWLRQHQNILITGATGCGKTYLACAIGQKHCQQGESEN
jgi:DNA replication protein DnaC